LTAHNDLLNLTAEQIDALTADAFAQLLERIRAGEDPQTAIAAIMATWEPAYVAVLAASFSEVLQRTVSSGELQDYKIGNVSLSNSLYQRSSESSRAVRELIRTHAAGYQDARTLAMQIYEGYGFKTRAGLPDDPIKWPRRSPKWPKYMREVINADAPSFAQYLAIARKAATNIKTPAYQSSINEALDALQKGRGEKVLNRKLEVAFQERMRYHATRIAQTELHRAYMDKQADEIMADETIQAVKVVMSATHPRIDICDVFAKQDKYGLGPGIYPKDKAPKPPFHPFCRCVLHSKRLIKTDNARENPDSERQYMARVMREDGASEAAKLIGGRGKLQAVLDGAGVDEILNAGRPAEYRLARLGD
jgi:hypothetical protein